MKIIIRAVLASAALCAIFGQAGNAADDPGPANPSPLPPPVLAPIYSWTGIYMGINAGYGTARLIESASRGADSLSASESGSGLIAGGQIGANYQSGVFVVGFEVDEQWSNQRSTYNLFGTTVTDKVVAFGTARVRRRHSNGSCPALPDGRRGLCRPQRGHSNGFGIGATDRICRRCWRGRANHPQCHLAGGISLHADPRRYLGDIWGPGDQSFERQHFPRGHVSGP